MTAADQRRADALVDVFAWALADPSLPEQHGKRPAIHVTVQLSTLPGCDNQPAHLDRHGPITADMARRIAADQSGTWRRLVTDDTGQLLDYHRTTYRPPTTSPTTSPPATEPAPSPHADMQPSCATSTTPRPGPTAATQTPQTGPPPAPDTTTPTTTPAGKSNTDKTEPESGPARPDTAI